MADLIHENELQEIFKPGILEQYATVFLTVVGALLVSLIVIAWFV